MIIHMHDKVGDFAENKDVARELRESVVLPSLAKSEEVVIDFTGVDGATQSFIHALVSEAIRQYRDVAFDNLVFKNTNPDIAQIITNVYNYMQESLD